MTWVENRGEVRFKRSCPAVNILLTHILKQAISKLNKLSFTPEVCMNLQFFMCCALLATCIDTDAATFPLTLVSKAPACCKPLHSGRQAGKARKPVGRLLF